MPRIPADVEFGRDKSPEPVRYSASNEYLIGRFGRGLHVWPLSKEAVRKESCAAFPLFPLFPLCSVPCPCPRLATVRSPVAPCSAAVLILNSFAFFSTPPDHIHHFLQLVQLTLRAITITLIFTEQTHHHQLINWTRIEVLAKKNNQAGLGSSTFSAPSPLHKQPQPGSRQQRKISTHCSSSLVESVAHLTNRHCVCSPRDNTR